MVVSSTAVDKALEVSVDVAAHHHTFDSEFSIQTHGFHNHTLILVVDVGDHDMEVTVTRLWLFILFIVVKVWLSEKIKKKVFLP